MGDFVLRFVGRDALAKPRRALRPDVDDAKPFSTRLPAQGRPKTTQSARCIATKLLKLLGFPLDEAETAHRQNVVDEIFFVRVECDVVPVLQLEAPGGSVPIGRPLEACP